jgi:hypothetical protein
MRNRESAAYGNVRYAGAMMAACEGPLLGGILGLEIFSLRERPDLRPLVFGSDLQSVWPEFMRHGAAARLYFAPWIFDRYLDYAFAGVTDGKVVARVFCVPFAINTEGRTELPDHGWDQVIRWAHDDSMIGRAPNALNALEISIPPEARGSGNSLALLSAMKLVRKSRGLERCSRRCDRTKSISSHAMSMHDYLNTVRADGFPVDAWLRAHLRVGGKIVKIAPYSMTIVG